jgi:hypothetical protein
MSTKSSMLASLLAAACLFGGSLAVTSATAGAGNPANVAVVALAANGTAGPSTVANLTSGSATLSATGNDTTFTSVSTGGEEALHDSNLLTLLLAAMGVMGLVVVRRSGNR